VSIQQRGPSGVEALLSMQRTVQAPAAGLAAWMHHWRLPHWRWLGSAA
jgi:hypothetical protein